MNNKKSSQNQLGFFCWNIKLDPSDRQVCCLTPANLAFSWISKIGGILCKLKSLLILTIILIGIEKSIFVQNVEAIGLNQKTKNVISVERKLFGRKKHKRAKKNKMAIQWVAILFRRMYYGRDSV